MVGGHVVAELGGMAHGEAGTGDRGLSVAHGQSGDVGDGADRDHGRDVGELGIVRARGHGVPSAPSTATTEPAAMSPENCWMPCSATVKSPSAALAAASGWPTTSGNGSMRRAERDEHRDRRSAPGLLAGRGIGAGDLTSGDPRVVPLAIDDLEALLDEHLACVVGQEGRRLGDGRHRARSGAEVPAGAGRGPVSSSTSAKIQ